MSIFPELADKTATSGNNTQQHYKLFGCNAEIVAGAGVVVNLSGASCVRTSHLMVRVIHLPTSVVPDQTVQMF